MHYGKLVHFPILEKKYRKTMIQVVVELLRNYYAVVLYTTVTSTTGKYLKKDFPYWECE